MKSLLKIWKMIISKIVPLISFIFVVFTACQNNQSQGKINADEDLFELDGQELSNTSKMNYRIPTAIDLFLLLENSGAKFNEEALNSPLKRVKYSTTASKAVNFGVYTTDLVYCSVFGDFQGSLIYFNTGKDVAVDLGLYEGYGEEIAFRINNNLSNVDSLIDISSDTYFKATTFLSEQGMADVMALIMTGCWIESLYVIVETVKQFDENDPLIERIADQQYLLDNLIGLMNTNKASSNVTEVLNLLLELQEVFDPLYFNDNDIIITKEQYVNIVNKIKEVRNELVS